jgi:hypothetical protein
MYYLVDSSDGEAGGVVTGFKGSCNAVVII